MFSTAISELFQNSLNPWRVVFSLIAALVIGLVIYFIYKKTFAGVVYSRSFNLSLIMLTLVSTLVLMMISSNMALSLGMVGALSIVRFRTAVKDPLDTVFLFWAIGEGLAVGAGFLTVGLIGVLVIGLLMLVVTGIKSKSAAPFLLILHYDEHASQQIKGMIRQLPKAHVKSKTVQRDGIELTIEVRVRESDVDFVDKFLRVQGVYDATLVAHQGDLLS